MARALNAQPDAPIAGKQAIKSGRFAPSGALALRPEAFGMMFEMPERSARVQNDSPVGVIDVVGPLMHHKEWCFDSYDAIKDRAREVAASSAKCGLLNIDCPGGLVAGCFDTVAEIRKIFADAGKPLCAYIDAQATSGGYALACAASKIFIPPSGIAGSIGVIDTLSDQTAADEMFGLRFVVIASGTRKADGNPHVSISEESIAAAQQMVDTLASQFHELVASARGISVETVKGYQAGLFCGQQALDAGLADELATFDQVVAMLASSGEQEAISAEIKGDSPMNLAEYKAGLKSIADDKDANETDREEARKMLSAIEGGDDKDKKDDDKEAKAESEKDPAEASAKSEAEPKHEEPDGDEGKKEEAKASASASGLAIAARLQVLEKAEAQRNAKAERSALMASRPDLAPEVVAFLDRQPLSVVRGACATPDKGGLPLGPGKGGQVAAARAAVGATPTLGAHTNGMAPPVGSLGLGAHSNLSGRGNELDRAMGLASAAPAIRMNGNTLELGVMTPEQAREFIDSQKAGAK
jgi:signal peptide peptidase SppA